MKNNVQKKSSELHSFVADRMRDTRTGNHAASITAIGIRLMQMAHEQNDAQFAVRVSEVAAVCRNFLENRGEHALVEVKDGDVSIITIKKLRANISKQANEFERAGLGHEENFCRLCIEIIRAFDTLDFSRQEGLPRACVKATYAGVDHDAIKHVVILLF